MNKEQIKKEVIEEFNNKNYEDVGLSDWEIKLIEKTLDKAEKEKQEQEREHREDLIRRDNQIENLFRQKKDMETQINKFENYMINEEVPNYLIDKFQELFRYKTSHSTNYTNSGDKNEN